MNGSKSVKWSYNTEVFCFLNYCLSCILNGSKKVFQIVSKIFSNDFYGSYFKNILKYLKNDMISQNIFEELMRLNSFFKFQKSNWDLKLIETSWNMFSSYRSFGHDSTIFATLHKKMACVTTKWPCLTSQLFYRVVKFISKSKLATQ